MVVGTVTQYTRVVALEFTFFHKGLCFLNEEVQILHDNCSTTAVANAIKSCILHHSRIIVSVLNLRKGAGVMRSNSCAHWHVRRSFLY